VRGRLQVFRFTGLRLESPRFFAISVSKKLIKLVKFPPGGGSLFRNGGGMRSRSLEGLGKGWASHIYMVRDAPDGR
jgi:hypothetical protein